jgi:hypothetical protein
MAMTEFGRLSRNRQESAGPQALFFTALLIAGAAWLFAERSLGNDAILPIVATLLFVLAAVATTVAWWRETGAGGEVTYWDVAGGLTFIGIGAAALIDPDQMLRLIASAPAETEALGNRR